MRRRRKTSRKTGSRAPQLRKPLQQTNKSLIETLDELNKIQNEGRAKRAAAEQELTRIEDELRAKMMEIRS